MKACLMRGAVATAAAAAAGGGGGASIGRRQHLSSYVWSLQQAILLVGAIFFIVLFSLQLLNSSCLLQQSISSTSSTSAAARFLAGHNNNNNNNPLSIASALPPHVANSPPRNLLLLHTPWNYLSFSGPAPSSSSPSSHSSSSSSSPSPPPLKLRIAVFVRKWPSGSTPGGLERHAYTLHHFLAERGHEVHVFTGPGNFSSSHSHHGSLIVHPHPPNSSNYNPTTAWWAFVAANATTPFDVVHTESVALHHTYAAQVPNVVASWHGIAFEVVHSNIVSELLRPANESRSPELQRTLSERLLKVSSEIRFFGNYRHHIAISDYVGEVLRTIYEIPAGNVHVILSGVDGAIFRPSAERGAAFRREVGIMDEEAVVLGVAGRLVKDKGHPLLIEVLEKMMMVGEEGGVQEESECKARVLIAGDGPWAVRYRELAPCVKVLGSMLPAQLAAFYNAIDVFLNPTLRAQGLDLTLLEAMMSGKPVLATRFASITRSVVREGSGVGYTFSPNAASLRVELERVVAEGRVALAEKGEAAFLQATRAFTSAKMGLSYERLFLCLTHARFCHYPLPHVDSS